MRLQKYLMSLSEWCVYLIVFAVPVIFSERFFLSYELPKLTLFRALILVMLLATVWRVLLQGRIEVWKVMREKRLKLILLGIFVVLLLSNAFAIAPNLSFWGSYFRLQGTYTFLHYLAFFILLGLNFHKSIQWERVLMFLSGGFFLVCSYAILQGFGFDFTGFNLQEVSLGRAYASLGQPNYLASYIVLAAFPVMTFLFARKRYAASVMMLFLGVIALGFSGSRGGVIGMGAGFLTFILLWHFYVKKQGKVILLLLVALISSVLVIDRDEEDALRSMDSRVHIWETTIDVVERSPLFGYGLDSFSLVFPRYTDGSLLKTERSNVVPDRAHNNILDILYAAGILGFLMFVISWWWIWKHSLKVLAKAGTDRTHIIGALSALVGVFVAHLVGFSMTVHFVLSTFLLGYLCFLFSDGKTSRRKLQLNKLIKKLILTVFVIFVAGSLVVYNFFFLFADHELKGSFYKIQHGELEIARELLSDAAFYYPYQSYIYFVLSAVEMEIGIDKFAMKSAQAGLDFASGEDGQGWFLLGEITENSEYYHQALYLMPYSPRLLLNWGILEIENDNCDLGADFLNKYIEILPEDWKTSGTEEYRLFYKHNPDFDKASEYLDMCIEKVPDF